MKTCTIEGRGQGRENSARLYGNSDAEIREKALGGIQTWRETGCRKSIAIPLDNVRLGSRNGERQGQSEGEGL